MSFFLCIPGKPLVRGCQGTGLLVGGVEWLPLHHLFSVFSGMWGFFPSFSRTKLSLPWPMSFFTLSIPVVSPDPLQGDELAALWVPVGWAICHNSTVNQKVELMSSASYSSQVGLWQDWKKCHHVDPWLMLLWHLPLSPSSSTLHPLPNKQKKKSTSTETKMSQHH